MTRAAAPKPRDLRIDLARGLCLWFILVDHALVGRTRVNILSQFTLHGFAVCDAADAFVFLCGVSAALAYGGKLDRAGWWEASKAVLRRVRVIYLAQLALIAALAVLVLAGEAFGQSEVQRFFWLGGHALDAETLLRLACLVDQPGLMAILPLYMALLSWFALIMPLIRRPLWLLALSLGLWAAVHLDPQDVRIGPNFNIVAWQLTFTLGVLCCRYAPLLRRPELRPLSILAIGLLAAGAWTKLALPHTWEAYDQFSLPVRALLRGRSKGDLDPGRVFSVLAFAWVIFRHVPRDAPWLHARWAATLIGLGQRSLPVFAAGVVLTGFSGWTLFAWQQSLAAEIVVNAAGLAGLMAAARLSKLRPSAIVRLPAAVTVSAPGQSFG